MSKEAIRREMLDMRQSMNEHSVKTASEAITARLLALACVNSAETVMAYSAIRNEPDMREFMLAMLDAGKRVALPCVTAHGLVAAEFRRDVRMKPGAYGILQPEAFPGCTPMEPDVVIVPGVVFDTQLCRIGFGAGYYDRFLESSRAVKIGVCYEAQLVDRIEADPHDVRMDFVVTERRVLEAV
jgi:5-formyltetrahydrofolate cyclo-ligase